MILLVCFHHFIHFITFQKICQLYKNVDHSKTRVWKCFDFTKFPVNYKELNRKVSCRLCNSNSQSARGPFTPEFSSKCYHPYSCQQLPLCLHPSISQWPNPRHPLQLPLFAAPLTEIHSPHSTTSSTIRCQKIYNSTASLPPFLPYFQFLVQCYEPFYQIDFFLCESVLFIGETYKVRQKSG